MSSDAIELLVVSHDASRTGAPLVLLSAARRLVEDQLIRPRFLLLRGGPLHADFEGLGPTVNLDREMGRSLGATVEVGLAELAPGKAAQRHRQLRVKRALRALGKDWTPDLVWLNSAGSLEVLAHLPGQISAVAFVHELGDGLDRSRPAYLAPGLERCRTVQVPSVAVASELQRRGVEPSRLAVRHPMLAGTRERFANIDRDECRARLNLDDDALIIGGSGGSVWRKGVDLLAPVAREVADQHDRAHFVWWGLDLESERVDELRRDLFRCGVLDRVTLLGSTAHPEHFLGACDVFWSPAREDPFPLTLGEAATAGVPIVATDAGGAAEFLGQGNDRGRLVPVLDADALAAAIVDLLGSPERRAMVSDEARRHVTEELSFDRFMSEVSADLQNAVSKSDG